MQLLALVAVAAVAAPVPDVMRAAHAENIRSLCAYGTPGPACSTLGDEASNLKIACAGLARHLVENDRGDWRFAGGNINDIVMVDSLSFVERRCADHPEMLDGLAARVDHGRLSSVEGFARVAGVVPGRAAEACAAWAESVTVWPSEVRRDLDYELRLLKVARCGDDLTVRAAFGPALESDPTGMTALGLALDKGGKPAGACEAYRRAYALDARAIIVQDAADRGIVSACGADGLRFVREAAQVGASEAGRPAEQRLRYASDAGSGLSSAEQQAAECDALADALVVTPVFEGPPAPEYITDGCTSDWRASTARRLNGAAASAEARGATAESVAFTALATWVTEPD